MSSLRSLKLMRERKKEPSSKCPLGSGGLRLRHIGTFDTQASKVSSILD
jgi:hypothetical protein